MFKAQNQKEFLVMWEISTDFLTVQGFWIIKIVLFFPS